MNNNQTQTQAQEVMQLLTGTRVEIEKGVEFLYRTERAKIFKALADYCTPSELEEIFSDALLALLKNVAIIKNSPIAYFRQICPNKASDLYQLNKRKRRILVKKEGLIDLEDELVDLEKNRFENGEDQNYLRAITILMNKVGEEDRRVLVQRYFQDWSNQEIAEEQGIENQSAANKLYRSIQKLRKVLEKEPILKEILEEQLYEAF